MFVMKNELISTSHASVNTSVSLQSFNAIVTTTHDESLKWLVKEMFTFSSHYLKINTTFTHNSTTITSQHSMQEWQENFQNTSQMNSIDSLIIPDEHELCNGQTKREQCRDVLVMAAMIEKLAKWKY